MTPQRLRFLKDTACLAAMVVATMPLGTATSNASVDLVNLGSGTFIIDPGGTSALYSQTSTNLVFSGPYTSGDTLAGIFDQQDWSAYTTFGLRMSLQGANPNLPFTVQFYDSSLGVIATYQGETTGLSLTPTVAMLTLSLTGTGDFSNVVGMQFTWDGSDAINTSIAEIVGFPPPTGGFFVARAPGGVEFLTGTNIFVPWRTTLATNATSWNPPSFATMIAPGAASWAMLSDSNAKTDVTAIDHREMLRRVAKLPVNSWRYKDEASLRHIGPMAQDFHEAFGLGFDDRHISTMDTDGVALSALKGLIAELQERKARSEAQEKKLAELEAELRELNEQVESSSPPAP